MKNIALVGVGKMGISHLANTDQIPGITVKAICDTSKPLLRFLEKNTPFKGFDDYKKMIDDVQIDGILINAPNSYHFEIAQYCIKKGICVFVEKPLTLRYVDSKALVDLAIENGVKGQVGYVNRFNPMFQRVKSLLGANVIGTVTNYNNRMVGSVVLTKSNKGWRNDYSKGGGCLFDYGPHCLDLATYLFGTDVQVQSSVLKKVFSTKVDDIVYATLLHNETIVGFNYINWSDCSVRKASNTVEIYGTKGKIIVNKQELSVFTTDQNPLFNLEQGWNQFYITDENTNVNFYLRGEDFSRQLEEFSMLLNGKIDQSISSLETTCITDKIVEDIYTLSGGLI